VESDLKAVCTYTATIYVGFKVTRKDIPEADRKTYVMADAEVICREYVDPAGLCVTLMPTRYVYTGGVEDGCAVGLINYPRFPSDRDRIRLHALGLARKLLKGLEQYKVSVVFPDETVMLGEDRH
jgi:hypothetical protein